MKIRKESDIKGVATKKRIQEREFIQFYKMNFIDSFYLFSLSLTCRVDMTQSLLQSCWEDESLFTVLAPNSQAEDGEFFFWAYVVRSWRLEGDVAGGGWGSEGTYLEVVRGQQGQLLGSETKEKGPHTRQAEPQRERKKGTEGMTQPPSLGGISPL